MFDSCHDCEPVLDSEHAADPVKVHPRALWPCARCGFLTVLRIGKLWRFRAFDLDQNLPEKVSSEQLSVPPHHS